METNSDHRRAALRAVFLREGYAGASIAKLAEATGLGKASLYHHFPGGKAAMAGSLIRDAIATLQQQVFTSAHPGDEPKAQLLALVDELERYADYGKAPCLLGLFALENADVVDREQLSAQFESWQQDLAAAFEVLGDAPKPARRRADRLLADFYGYLTLAALRSNPDAFTRGMKQLRREIKKL